jgi:hypothetical protein
LNEMLGPGPVCTMPWNLLEYAAANKQRAELRN